MENNTLSRRSDKDSKVAAAVAISVTAGVALAALSIAVLTAVYCRSLLDVEYINDSDVYTE